jgi:hypothetical protein
MPKSPFGWRELRWVPSAGIKLSKPTFLFAGAISIRNVRDQHSQRAYVARGVARVLFNQFGSRLNPSNDLTSEEEAM